MGQPGGTKSSLWEGAKIPKKSPAGLVPGAPAGRNPLGAPGQTALWMLPYNNGWMLLPARVSPYSWDPFGVVIWEDTTTLLWVRGSANPSPPLYDVISPFLDTSKFSRCSAFVAVDVSHLRQDQHTTTISSNNFRFNPYYLGRRGILSDYQSLNRSKWPNAGVHLVIAS
ncbi:hypothetical protein FB451DRAFT_1437708 [Mycena latifolia]|nr:hypothetical protein FB451DRAFT_1437708 [Mycena latifolia]